MSPRLALAISVLISCGPAPKKPVGPERDAPERPVSITSGEPVASSPGLPAPPAGFATSDLVMMIGGDVSTWTITDGKLVKTGTMTLVKVPADELAEAGMMGVGSGEWADRDHLFVTIGAHDVVMITAQAATRVPVPPASTFDMPKPTDSEGDMVRANGGELSAHGLVVTAGEVYWQQCAWGLPYDGFQCAAWVQARLWPSPGVDKGSPALESRKWRWSAAPAGYSTKATDKAVACTGPKGKSSIPTGTGGDGSEADEQIEGAQWVSTEPPRLLVTYGHFGLAALYADRWTLHEGCVVPPLATGTTATPGPSGLWIGASKDDGPITLYRGATIIGELPAHANVLLRPTK